MCKTADTQSNKVNRKVQGVQQSHITANPRHQEEEKNVKKQHVQNKQMHEKHTDQLPLTQARWSQC